MLPITLRKLLGFWLRTSVPPQDLLPIYNHLHKSMPIRSMTGFAQVKGQIGPELAFTLSLKSVNHRFLDVHFRLPADSDGLEMKLRRLLKEKLARGHIELSLNLDRGSGEGFALNKQLVGGYIQAFRAAAAEFGLATEPDLNVVLRIPGALESGALPANALEEVVAARAEELCRNLTRCGKRKAAASSANCASAWKLCVRRRRAWRGIATLRCKVIPTSFAPACRNWWSAGGFSGSFKKPLLLVNRSDIQEELVRLDTHVNHFLGLLSENGEIGKKLDFLLQEMNREANTLLSKTSGLAGEALNITQMGLAIKSELEKAREQVQNIE